MRILNLMQSSIIRMSGLIDNVLDFARGRLGGGIVLKREHRSVEPALRQVVEELRIGNADRVIEERYDLAVPITCDHDRIAQMFSNLVGNALRYGLPEQPIEVEASVAEGQLSISVANAGSPIPAGMVTRLFEPFVRGEDSTDREGLGLGLHIASEIAKAHGGTITATSNDERTRFTARLPV